VNASVASLRAKLLAWYDANARALPWRVGPKDRARGVGPDPYRVWLSEVMLQQTTVAHATSYFLDFTRRWPTMRALAAAPEAEVMAAWAGLGYYARARNLIACARAVAGEHGGAFPDSETGLLGLPGVGPYTAAAVAAIAFDAATNVVDGNVERVMARLYAVGTALPAAKPELKALAGELVRDDRPGDWAQALMDLGAVICRPKAPLCDRCPLAAACAARKSGAPETYPRRGGKADRPRRHGAAYVLTFEGEIALAQRPPRGLLGGMLGLPTSDWGPAALTPSQALTAAPSGTGWRGLGGIEHVFTHFALTLQVWRGAAQSRDPAFVWLPAAEAAQALPSVFRKALEAGLSKLI
jgi:A/G-specific adenine glycosylase